MRSGVERTIKSFRLEGHDLYLNGEPYLEIRALEDSILLFRFDPGDTALPASWSEFRRE